jgi:flagellar biosynthesis protein FlhF
MEEVLHTFTGSTLNEAYQKMRKKLGDNAVVVRSAEVKASGWRGALGAKGIEVTAAKRAPRVERRPSAVERRYGASTAPKSKTPSVPDSPAAKPEAVAEAMAQKPKPEPARTSSVSAEALRKEIHEVRRMVEMLTTEHPGIGLPRECFPHYRRLLAGGMPRPMATSLLTSIAEENEPRLLRDEAVFHHCLRREVRRRSMVTGGIAWTPGECHTVALVGSTGVGKTTNLAKLAARYTLNEHANVALVTLDTYRVGAPDQLRVYADIMGIPMHVVNDEEEARAIKKELNNYDLILVDTAGGSPFNRDQIAELRDTLLALKPDEVIHTLAANTPFEDLQHALRAFKLLNPTALMITKLDETRLHGALYAALAEARLPLSYFSVGQNVPDDILLAQPDTIADFVIKSGEEAA